MLENLARRFGWLKMAGTIDGHFGGKDAFLPSSRGQSRARPPELAKVHLSQIQGRETTCGSAAACAEQINRSVIYNVVVNA